MGDDGTFERLVDCRRVHNFRDYGGYATSQGRLRRGRLFRSAQHFDADDADLAKIGDLDLGAVIDLRGRSEREAAPCPRPSGFDAAVILVDEETATQAPHVEAVRGGVMDVTEARAAMLRAYRSLPFRPVLRRLYMRYFAVVADTDRPTLIHCLAGKDRTGIAVALFHHLVGVHRDDMMADYLLTNTVGNIEARVRAGGAHIKALFGDMSDDGLRAVMSVEPEYLDTAFATMTERYGSVDGYLCDALEVTAERRDRIVARLVV